MVVEARYAGDTNRERHNAALEDAISHAKAGAFVEAMKIVARYLPPTWWDGAYGDILLIAGVFDD